jgi:hypothetical protein
MGWKFELLTETGRVNSPILISFYVITIIWSHVRILLFVYRMFAFHSLFSKKSLDVRFCKVNILNLYL